MVLCRMFNNKLKLHLFVRALSSAHCAFSGALQLINNNYGNNQPTIHKK